MYCIGTVWVWEVQPQLLHVCELSQIASPIHPLDRVSSHVQMLPFAEHGAMGEAPVYQLAIWLKAIATGESAPPSVCSDPAGAPQVNQLTWLTRFEASPA